MVDPQKPKYDKPYCWKCQGHTDFIVVTVDLSDERGSRYKKVKKCGGCGKKMNAPRDMDSAYYGPWGVGCLSVYFPLTFAAILWLALDGGNWTDENGNPVEGGEQIFFASILALLCLVFPAKRTCLEKRGFLT